MDFTTILGTIFTSIAIFAITIGIITNIIKSVLERINKIKASWYWKETILPALPYLIGVLIYFIANKLNAEIAPVYIILLGSASSSYFYRIWKSYLRAATKKVEDEDKSNEG